MTCGAACVALVLGAVVLFGIDRAVLGREVLLVASGSMSPAIAVGDIVVVGTDHRAPLAGDVITFRGSSGPLVTHRVVSVGTDRTGSPVYSTKGDANEDADPTPVPLASVVGTVESVVPTGRVLSAMTDPAVAVPVVLAVLLAESALIVRPRRADGTNDPQPGKDSHEGSRQKEKSTT
ncbi:MAG: hypothetical protein RLZZ305_34 [Actinomycetota bacterium]|jgi:signal peptidase